MLLMTKFFFFGLSEEKAIKPKPIIFP